MEKLEISLQRLSKNDIKFVELHGNLYSQDLGYKPAETIRVLTEKYDETEFYRAAEGIRIVSEDFYKAGIRCAIEPVRRDEVSFCFTIAEAKSLIDEVNHPGCLAHRRR